MRVIKFRGKATEDGTWRYGNICALSDGVFILEEYNCGNINEPEYHHSGMGCGLEDRRITDRYDAMYHGWESCIERYADELPCFIEVIPETVGQCTGLYDKNGKEIYEGDTCKVDDYYFCNVIFDTTTAKFTFDRHITSCFLNASHTIEIIGNVFDDVRTEA